MAEHRIALLRFLAASLVAAIAFAWFGIAARHIGDPVQLVLHHPAGMQP